VEVPPLGDGLVFPKAKDDVEEEGGDTGATGDGGCGVA
jgi:hypothetical protein